jgi:hypothetical protein
MTHEDEGRSFHFLAENNDAAESWVYMIRFVLLYIHYSHTLLMSNMRTAFAVHYVCVLQLA